MGGETQPLSAGLLPGPALRGCQAPPEYPGATHLCKGAVGGRALPWRKACAGGGWVPDLHRSLLPLHFRVQCHRRGFSPQARGRVLVDGGFSATRQFRALPQPDSARRERILGTAGGSAGDKEPGAASQTGWRRSEPAGQGAHRRAPGEPGQQSG